MLTHFKSYSIKVNDKLFQLDCPKVMGILNTTYDSFYDGGKYHTIDSALQRVEDMLNEGADMVDIGGQSSRPGAEMISEHEESSRTIPVIKAIRQRFPDLILSIDTFRASVARQAIEAGAAIVNDISAGEDDKDMLQTVARLNVPYIAMHKQGLPKTMQQNPQYTDVAEDLMDYFTKKTELCRSLGIKDLIIDPGFGFGKTLKHNYELMDKLSLFHQFNCPILIGVSRKSMICQLLKVDPKDALNGSTVLHTIAVLQGAHILRVHDVKQAVETVKICGQFTIGSVI
jgi:dihydropteroate synthase